MWRAKSHNHDIAEWQLTHSYQIKFSTCLNQMRSRGFSGGVIAVHPLSTLLRRSRLLAWIMDVTTGMQYGRVRCRAGMARNLKKRAHLSGREPRRFCGNRMASEISGLARAGLGAR